MSKVLLISGSNRKGNTDFILNYLNKHIDNSNIILLKNKNIEYCKGCLACHHNKKCIIKDDINSIIDKLIESELIIFGVPNYFDNVSGLFKNFMDRLHPLYKSKQLKDKKVIFIYVGGGEENGTKEELHQAIKGFSKYLSIDIINEFSFKALNIDEIKKQENKIKEIADTIKKYI
jgi:multimeric flavodoxin WrbA